MSDLEKPTPESPRGRDGEATSSPPPSPPAPAANVISIEQARAELLRRPRKGATPPRGLDGPPRSRRREVPAPVTLPPGEHSAVIVTDTPAARAHIDKKTVHPGEAPGRTHEKKVRVKTHFDPGRVKTQLTGARAAEVEAAREAQAAADEEVGSLWSNRASQNPEPEPGAVTTGRTPRSTSLARPRPISREDRSGTPLFVVAVMVVAAVGAVVVFMLSRQKGDVASGAPETAATVAPAAPPATSTQVAGTAPATATGGASAPGGSAAASGAPATSGSSAPTGPVVAKPVTSAPAAKPPATAAPKVTAQPTATSILPFGKEEP